MKIFILFILSAVLLVGCASENQQKALAKVAEIYGAKTGYTKGFKNEITYFSIQVSDSDIIEDMDAVKVASNISLMVYDNFSEVEKKDYSHIEVEIAKKSNPNDKIIRNYKLSELVKPQQQTKIFDNFSNAVKNGDFQMMSSLIDPQYRKADDADYIKDYIKKFVDENGKIVDYKRTGFGLRLFENNTTNYEFSGFFVFENNKHLNYSLQTYDDVNSQYIYSFHID